jgi:hypothetical protein
MTGIVDKYAGIRNLLTHYGRWVTAHHDGQSLKERRVSAQGGRGEAFSLATLIAVGFQPTASAGAGISLSIADVKIASLL